MYVTGLEDDCEDIMLADYPPATAVLSGALIQSEGNCESRNTTNMNQTNNLFSPMDLGIHKTWDFGAVYILARVSGDALELNNTDRHFQWA